LIKNKGMNKVIKYIYEKFENEEKMLFTVLDPLDHKDVEHAVETAKRTYEGGADAILIGGSTGVQGEILDGVTKRVREVVDIPIILFPGNIGTVTKYADALYFMSLLNSRNPYWITRAQMLAAPVVKRLGIEAIPTAYIVVEPGGTVGWVGDVDLIPRNKPKIAAAFALAADMMGFKLIITDAGSNPKEGHIPLEMIKSVKSVITKPYVVAGGIRTPEQAKNVVKAGADIIQVGTAFEKDAGKRIKMFIKAIKG